MQHYYQFQVVMKPNPMNILDLYFDSLRIIGIHPEEHDIRLMHDDWETAALGAWGLGWEVWCDGTEISQFTYFQQVGGIELGSITGEITYGLERICMFLQNRDNVYDIQYNDHLTYGDIYRQNEVQFSRYNFELADIDLHLRLFAKYEKECRNLCKTGNPAPALDFAMKASHCFNILDARNAISVNERQNYVLRLRSLAKSIAEQWLENRTVLNFPLCQQTSKTDEVKMDTPSLQQKPQDTVQIQTEPLLIELGVEEMPAGVFKSLLQQLPEIWNKLIEPSGLDCRSPKFYVTPPRIAILASSLQTRQPDEQLELKGPPASMAKDEKGNWTLAALGFARKNNLDPEKLSLKSFGKNQYLYAEVHRKGRTASDILCEIVPLLFSRIHWYKNMRWGEGKATPFVRPVQWLVVLLGQEIIPVEFVGVKSSNQSRGHRFLSQGTINVTPESYLSDLKEACVIADQAERKSVIREMIDQTAKGHNLSWRSDEDLLDQATHMVEYPVPVLGFFDKQFLKIPQEVLVSEMKYHQKYFALTDKTGILHNSFLAVCNMRCRDMVKVQSGYENVLKSRLYDAQFFLKEDLKIPLAKRRESLKSLAFETGLGSVFEKTARMKALALWMAEQLNFSSKKKALVSKIASLAKADLTTQMVFEFPELQGEMGRYYALQEKYAVETADGIRDHYLPRDAYDELPPQDESALVSLADRIDSIAGLFAAGKIPTGSADPMGLRRACLASISILIDRRFSLGIDTLVEKSIRLYGKTISSRQRQGLKEKTLDFYLGRAKKLFREKSRPGTPGGFAWDTIESVAKADSPWFDFSDLADRIGAMHAFRQQPDFDNVATSYKRVSNILEKKMKGSINPSLFKDPTEKDLLKAVKTVQASIEKLLKKKDYLSALAKIGSMRNQVDALFDAVMINDKNPKIRNNRHLLVQKVKDLVIRVADFSVIQE
jgi:glycyl-tRNA synthetase